MDKEELIILKGIKDNINRLIENGYLKEAEELLHEYQKINSNDIEIYSIRAVIRIMEGKLIEAENIINNGLKIDNNNFDLNYNLAYLYEQNEEYTKALIGYRKILRQNYYNIDIIGIETKIYELKENIKADVKNSFDLNIANIDNILFIAFNVNEKTHMLADILKNYGINIDLAYSGTNPINQLAIKVNPYRKILGITNLDHLIEYAKYYNYDSIHIFNASSEIKKYFKMKGLKVLCEDVLDKPDEKIIAYYSTNKFNIYTQHKCIENSNITILIPTYNRPHYLNRVLTFINNYKYIKAKVVVLDSSEESNKIENKKIVNKLKNSNLIYNQYHHKINFFKKLNNGLKNVNTEYVCLCADDDFLTEEGIIESIKKLDEEKNLYSVKGKNLYFTYAMANLMEYDWFEGLNQNDPIERLKKITQGFVPSLIYQVFRIDKFKKMYLFIEDNIKELPKNDTFTEYLFYFMVIVTGKIGKINIDLNIRDKSVPREMEIKNFPHAIVDGSFNENYKAFSDFLKKYFIYLGENAENIDKYMPKIFGDFLVNFLNVPKENVCLINNMFEIKELEKGMKKSWVWPSNL